MARYYVDQPFTYVTQHNEHRHVPAGGPPPASRIFDTADPKFDVTASWVPPVVGVRPMDSAAQTALNNARAAAGVVGKQLPGIGVVPANEPIFNP